MPSSNKFWSGTADSFNAAVAGMEKAQAFISMGNSAPELPPIWGKQDGLAVIDVQGALVSGSSDYGRFYGVLGYDDIRSAMVEAILDPEVKSLMMYVRSGGGAVAGADDLGKFVSKMCGIKPITVYTDSTMASAAYWIACGADNIMASQTAIVGSLGILSVHTERSKQMEELGVKATIIRAGKYKALANSIEPLSEAALAEMQSQVDDLYDIFMSHVGECRGVSASVADAEMGQGREFLGKRALTAGLVDKIATYEQAIASAKKLDKTTAMANNSVKMKGRNMKASLSEAQLAALAAGATLESLTASADTVITTAVPPVAPVAEVAVTAPVAAPAPAPVADTAPASAPVVLTAEVVATDNAVVALLQSQLAAASDALTTAKAEALNYKAQVDANSTTQAGLLAIAREAVGKMSVALGGNSDVAATLDATAVVAQYATVSETFKTKFKVGGVAATAQATSKGEAQISPILLAMIQAAKGN